MVTDVLSPRCAIPILLKWLKPTVFRIVSERADLQEAIQEMLNAPGAFFLEAVIKPDANVEPMTAPGRAVDEMQLNVEC